MVLRESPFGKASPSHFSEFGIKTRLRLCWIGGQATRVRSPSTSSPSLAMDTIATNKNTQDNGSTGPVKKVAEKVFDPFYSPTIEDDGKGADYK